MECLWLALGWYMHETSRDSLTGCMVVSLVTSTLKRSLSIHLTGVMEDLLLHKTTEGDVILRGGPVAVFY
jgi:hypothetical protein